MMAVSKDEVADLIGANNDHLKGFIKDLLKDTVRQIKHAIKTSAEQQMKETKKLKYNELHKFKRRANKDSPTTFSVQFFSVFLQS